eukprot:gene7925-7995_t
MFTPNQVQLAHTLADSLDDQKSLAFYLTCAQKYPKDFLLATLTHVCALPDHSVRTTRARLFTIGTTNTGVCVLKDGMLLDRHIHTYHAAWSDHKLRIITNRYRQYVLKHNVTAIMVKIPPMHKRTPYIAQIMKQVEALAKEYGCEFDFVLKGELKDSVGARSTADLVLCAKYLYPELTALFERGKANDHSYYKKLYEAVLAAHNYESSNPGGTSSTAAMSNMMETFAFTVPRSILLIWEYPVLFDVPRKRPYGRLVPPLDLNPYYCFANQIFSSMKKIIFLALLFPVLSSAQILGLGKKLAEYKASNGMTYHIGDTVKLGQGSAPNGTFRYLQYAGWATFLAMGDEGSDSHNAERNLSGYGAVIKKIHQFKAHGINKVVFAVGMGGVNNFDLWIEDAIVSCEIADCTGRRVSAAQAPPSDNLDRLRKLKALLDAGAVTRAEYDAQKKKLLEQKGALAALLLAACLGIHACKKAAAPKPAAKVDSRLLIGIFSRTKVEVSNSGAAWKDLTPSYPGEILTFSSDGTYVDQEGNATDSGYWEVPPNSSTLVKGSIDYDITALDAHTLVLVLAYASPVSASDGGMYQYWRYSYGR